MSWDLIVLQLLWIKNGLKHWKEFGFVLLIYIFNFLRSEHIKQRSLTHTTDQRTFINEKRKLRKFRHTNHLYTTMEATQQSCQKEWMNGRWKRNNSNNAATTTTTTTTITTTATTTTALHEDAFCLGERYAVSGRLSAIFEGWQKTASKKDSPISSPEKMLNYLLKISPNNKPRGTIAPNYYIKMIIIMKMWFI